MAYPAATMPASLPGLEDLNERLGRLQTAAAARGLEPVLTLAQSVWPQPRTRWHAASHTGRLLLANLEVADAATAQAVIQAASGHDLECVLDVSTKGPQSTAFRELLVQHPTLLWYSDLSVWAEAILAVIGHHLPPSPLHEVLLVGASPLTDAVAQRAVALGYDVTRAVAIVGAEPGPLAVVGASFHTPVITRDALEKIAADGVTPLCVDGGIGSFHADALEFCHTNGWNVWRPDMRGALAAAIGQARQYRALLGKQAGRGLIAGVPVVAGGVVGQAGDIVLDRLDVPTQVLGWADGSGGLVRETATEEWLQRRALVEGELG